MRGIIYDDIDSLNDAKLIVRRRADGTLRGADLVKDVAIKDRITIIQKAYQLEHTNVLNWVMQQPNWDDGLDKEIKKLAIKGPERYEGRTKTEWRAKYYALKQHHYNEHHIDVTVARNKLKVSQSKLNALLAWYWDDPKYLDKVDYNDLDQDWVDGYKQRLKESPGVEAYLFKAEGEVGSL